MRTFVIKTQAGLFKAHFSNTGLAQLDFPSNGNDVARDTDANGKQPAEIARWKKLTEAALQRALRGRSPGRLPPLDLSAATGFQREVWNTLRSIPAGLALSYAQVASAIRRPKATRAVGQACGANPIPVLIPCHRVLAANQRLGGFSGGLDWKKRLLALEGVDVK